MTISLYPVKEQIETLLASASEQPVVMLNLLRFKERATANRAAGLEGQWLLATTTRSA